MPATLPISPDVAASTQGLTRLTPRVEVVMKIRHGREPPPASGWSGHP